MESEKMFEKGLKSKVRFNSSNGQLTIEDLYELSLISLNKIGMPIMKELKSVTEDSLIETKTKSTSELELKLAILKYIIEDKQKADIARLLRKDKMAELAMWKEMYAKKSIEDMSKQSSDEMFKKIQELEQSL